MATKNILTHSPTNGQAFTEAFIPQDTPIDLNKFIAGKVDFYTQEVKRLEAELKHAQILLKAHQTWLLEKGRTK